MGRHPHQAQRPRAGSVAGFLDIFCNDYSIPKFTSQLNGFVSAYPRAFLISGQVVLGEKADILGHLRCLLVGQRYMTRPALLRWPRTETRGRVTLYGALLAGSESACSTGWDGQSRPEPYPERAEEGKFETKDEPCAGP